MKILIMDDSPSKLANLKMASECLFPQAEVVMHGCQHDLMRAVQGCMEDIRKEPEGYLLILDMQVPLFEGGWPEVTGGMTMLDWLQQNDLKCPAIVVSSELVDEERARQAYDYYKGFVRYSVMVSPTSAMREVLAEYLAT